MRTALAALLALAGFFLGSPPASGETADDAEAVRLFRQGRELVRAGRQEEACRKFRASLELDRSPGTLLNVASCLEREGELLAAIHTFEEAEAAAQSHSGRRKALWTDAAHSAVKRIEPRIPTVRLERAHGEDLPEDCSTTIDERRANLRGGRVVVAPGAHELSVRCPGYRPFRRSLQLEERERLRLTVALEEVPAPEVLTPSPATGGLDLGEDAGRKSTSWAPKALVMGGGALAVVGLASGVVAWSKKQDLKGQCPGDECPVDERDSANTFATGANVLVGSGAALLLTGGLWWALSGDDTEASDDNRAQLGADCSLGRNAGCMTRIRWSF